MEHSLNFVDHEPSQGWNDHHEDWEDCEQYHFLIENAIIRVCQGRSSIEQTVNWEELSGHFRDWLHRGEELLDFLGPLKIEGEGQCQQLEMVQEYSKEDWEEVLLLLFVWEVGSH